MNRVDDETRESANNSTKTLSRIESPISWSGFAKCVYVFQNSSTKKQKQKRII